MAKKVFFEKTKLISVDSAGDDDALDNIDGDADGMEDGTKAFITESGYVLSSYTLDADYGDVAGDPPQRVKPLWNHGSLMWIQDKWKGRIERYINNSMSADETFTEVGNKLIAFLNPNGADRAFNPSGSFEGGFEVIIYNIGNAYNILFDYLNSSSGGIETVITSGAGGLFHYDETNSVWRAM